MPQTVKGAKAARVGGDVTALEKRGGRERREGWLVHLEGGVVIRDESNGGIGGF